MGAVTGLLGLGGGANGTGFSTNAGTNNDQLKTSYNQNQNLLNALQGQNGIGNQSQVYGQLQNVVAGQGPNPAQATLNQATGANVANQAALMAGQRGAGANPGLIARQAAQQGANIQQQAAGQGAVMQANQSLGALGQAGNMANTMTANQIGATQNEQNILQNANTANNQNQAGMAQQTMQNQGKLIGGIANGVGGALGSIFAQGGPIQPAQAGPKSSFAQYLQTGAPMPMAKGGQVQAKVSPGETIIQPQDVKPVADGKVNAMAVGEKVPGAPKYKGDDYRNDVVDKKLPENGFVIPNHVMQSKDPARGAADFVRAVLAKKGMR